ncbi:MAG: EpsI family protein [Desulforegulaceae bacterium]|nr:EpsI family protein [Desulforegulaceae bacterium]
MENKKPQKLYTKYKKVIILAILMFFAVFVLSLAKDSKEIQPLKDFSKFPLKIGKWQGEKDFFNQKIYDILGVDDSVLAHYKDDKNQYVQLYIGFYRNQKEGDLIHSPKNCMPGAGWNIVNSGIEEVVLEDDKTIKVIKLNLKKDSEEQIVLYWFHSRGRIISSEYFQKIWLVIDSVTRGRTDGSFVRLVSPVNETRDKTLEILKEFTSEIYPYLNEYIPS